MRQSELSASPKPQLLMPKLHPREQSLQRGRSTFLKAHRASPYQHHCTTASKGRGHNIPSEPCHTGHGMLVKARKQEGQRSHPSSLLHTLSAPLCPTHPSGQNLGVQLRLVQFHGANRSTHTIGGRGPFAWCCIPPAPGVSAAAARPVPAGTGSGAAGPAWQCRRCA